MEVTSQDTVDQHRKLAVIKENLNLNGMDQDLEDVILTDSQLDTSDDFFQDEERGATCVTDPGFPKKVRLRKYRHFREKTQPSCNNFHDVEFAKFKKVGARKENSIDFLLKKPQDVAITYKPLKHKNVVDKKKGAFILQTLNQNKSIKQRKLVLEEWEEQMKRIEERKERWKSQVFTKQEETKLDLEATNKLQAINEIHKQQVVMKKEEIEVPVVVPVPVKKQNIQEIRQEQDIQYKHKLKLLQKPNVQEDKMEQLALHQRKAHRLSVKIFGVTQARLKSMVLKENHIKDDSLHEKVVQVTFPEEEDEIDILNGKKIKQKRKSIFVSETQKPTQQNKIFLQPLDKSDQKMNSLSPVQRKSIIIENLNIEQDHVLDGENGEERKEGKQQSEQQLFESLLQKRANQILVRRKSQLMDQSEAQRQSRFFMENLKRMFDIPTSQPNSPSLSGSNNDLQAYIQQAKSKNDNKELSVITDDSQLHGANTSYFQKLYLHNRQTCDQSQTESNSSGYNNQSEAAQDTKPSQVQNQFFLALQKQKNINSKYDVEFCINENQEDQLSQESSEQKSISQSNEEESDETDSQTQEIENNTSSPSKQFESKIFKKRQSLLQKKKRQREKERKEESQREKYKIVYQEAQNSIFRNETYTIISKKYSEEQEKLNLKQEIQPLQPLNRNYLKGRLDTVQTQIHVSDAASQNKNNIINNNSNNIKIEAQDEDRALIEEKEEYFRRFSIMSQNSVLPTSLFKNAITINVNLDSPEPDKNKLRELEEEIEQMQGEYQQEKKKQKLPTIQKNKYVAMFKGKLPDYSQIQSKIDYGKKKKKNELKLSQTHQNLGQRQSQKQMFRKSILDIEIENFLKKQKMFEQFRNEVNEIFKDNKELNEQEVSKSDILNQIKIHNISQQLAKDINNNKYDQIKESNKFNYPSKLYEDILPRVIEKIQNYQLQAHKQHQEWLSLIKAQQEEQAVHLRSSSQFNNKQQYKQIRRKQFMSGDFSEHISNASTGFSAQLDSIQLKQKDQVLDKSLFFMNKKLQAYANIFDMPQIEQMEHQENNIKQDFRGSEKDAEKQNFENEFIQEEQNYQNLLQYSKADEVDEDFFNKFLQQMNIYSEKKRQLEEQIIKKMIDYHDQRYEATIVEIKRIENTYIRRSKEYQLPVTQIEELKQLWKKSHELFECHKNSLDEISQTLKNILTLKNLQKKFKTTEREDDISSQQRSQKESNSAGFMKLSTKFMSQKNVVLSSQQSIKLSTRENEDDISEFDNKSKISYQRSKVFSKSRKGYQASQASSSLKQLQLMRQREIQKFKEVSSQIEQNCKNVKYFNKQMLKSVKSEKQLIKKNYNKLDKYQL